MTFGIASPPWSSNDLSVLFKHLIGPHNTLESQLQIIQHNLTNCFGWSYSVVFPEGNKLCQLVL